MAKTIKAETGVSLTGQFTQSQIPAMLDVLNAKISALKGDQEKTSRITGDLPGFGKISSVTDVNQLRKAYAHVTKNEAAIKEFDEAFKAVAPTCKLPIIKEGGASAKQWQDEIMLQFRDITFKEELDKLEKAKNILQDSLSEDMKLQAKMADIAELLKVSE